ncbi:MAG TPA: hypothetical protein VFD58_00575 [Blastocatellia bacterium]|nr:hypothetical protein [Blastocatellia bacterium]
MNSLIGGAASTTTDTVTIQPKRLSRLCVVTAADVEFRAVAGLLGPATDERSGALRLCRGRVGRLEVTLLISEIGASGFAEGLATHLAATEYDGLIVIGLAGGLDPGLKTGDAVVYDSCIRARIRADFSAVNISAESFAREKRSAREEIASLACDAELSNQIFETLKTAEVACRRVTGLTVDRVIIDAADKRALGRRYGAAAADMETYQVLAVCERFGLPATAVRLISDEADEDLPDFNRALNSEGKISNLKASLVMIARPVAAARFLFNFSRVLSALRQVASLVFNGAAGGLA